MKKDKKGIDLKVHCKKCNKDPYDCTCGSGKKGKTDLQHAMSIWNRLKKLDKTKMSEEQKRKLIVGLRTLKEEVTGNIGGETDIANPDNFVSEDEVTMERNAIAKTFDTEADFDTYVNQHRGIEMTPKEQQAIIGYKNAKATQQDKFFVKYENTDSFGTNDTTVVKKLKEGNQFCWTAFSKHESAEEEGKPEGGEDQENGPVTVNDKIRITKTITFTSDVEGANILGDFLRKLDI